MGDAAAGVVKSQYASANPTVNTPTFVSGTAQQDPTNLKSTYFVNVGLHAAGTVAVAIGPTSAVAVAVIPAGDATLAQTLVVPVPAGWWIKVTVGGAATIVGVVQVAS